MIATIRRMWGAAPVATVLLVLALMAAVFFGVRLGVSTLYWNDPARQDQAIAGWMTPRYVSMSWDVPHEVIGEALALARGEGRPKNLDQIARERGVPVADLVAALEAAIAGFRATLPKAADR